MKVLSTKEYMDIITWLPDGKSFTIVRPKAFVGDILPKEFKQAKYSSFTRKLHRWGFQRHLRGEEAGAFFHKLFQRGRLDLVERMSCYKPDQSKTPSSLLGTKQPGLGFRDPIMARPPVNRSLMMHQQGQQPQQQGLMGMQGNPMHGQAQRTGAGGDVGSVDRLNAAIELEVNRRLKERITAATLSRQALALMQQQQLPNNDPRNGFAGSSTGGSNPLGLNLLGKLYTEKTEIQLQMFETNIVAFGTYRGSGRAGTEQCGDSTAATAPTATAATGSAATTAAATATAAGCMGWTSSATI